MIRYLLQLFWLPLLLASAGTLSLIITTRPLLGSLVVYLSALVVSLVFFVASVRAVRESIDPRLLVILFSGVFLGFTDLSLGTSEGLYQMLFGGSEVQKLGTSVDGQFVESAGFNGLLTRTLKGFISGLMVGLLQCALALFASVLSREPSSHPIRQTKDLGIYATFWSRFGALVIDTIVLLPFIWLFRWASSFGPGFQTSLVVALLDAVLVLYSIVLHAKFGQTVGKMFLRVKVVNLSGGAVTWSQATLRDIGLIALLLWGFSYSVIDPDTWYQWRFFVGDSSGAAPFTLADWLPAAWLMLELITMLTNKRRRSLHDFIAGTIVIKQNSQTQGGNESPANESPIDT